MDDPESLPETVADLLEQGRLIHRLAGPLTVLAAIAAPVLALGWPHRGVLAALSIAVVLGLVETVLALRVAFDVRALRRIAEREDGLARFDAALVALGLMSADRSGRAMADRGWGCLRLLCWQAAIAVAQVAVLLAAGWMAI